jgi:hypothetical protein
VTAPLSMLTDPTHDRLIPCWFDFRDAGVDAAWRDLVVGYELAELDFLLGRKSPGGPDDSPQAPSLTALS